ncbi:MAG: 6-phosphogluconolactonase [Urechidicola sp.]|jgi:6-phosphogluconolactonase
MKNKQPDILTFKVERFSDESSIIIRDLIANLLAENEVINIALSGGNSPLPIYNKLSKFDLSWNRLKFFMVDERCVSQDSSENNFYNISNCFFNFISSDSFPVIKDDLTYQQAAINYQETIKQHVASVDGIPQFHLIILGMGLDGHTASLFPDTEALSNDKDLIVLNHISKLSIDRITMTYPLILNAKKIILIANGVSKKKVLDNILEKEYPISKIIPKISMILN